MDLASVYTHFEVPFFSLPISAAIILITLPIAAIIGYSAGKARRQRAFASDVESEMAQDDTTLSAILALLGLLLAFSFGNSLSHSQDIKSSITNEAAALGTAFLRTDYIEEPKRTELREALLAYTETRLVPGDRVIDSQAKARAFMEKTLEAQAKLWPLTLEATQDPMPPATKSLLVTAMNDALDAHLYRVQQMSNPISDVTKLMMLAAALVALFLLGNRAGLKGRHLTWRVYVFSVFLFFVMITILDTQRGNEGIIRVDDTTLRATLLDMQLALSPQTQQ
ncbi:MAG: hypothetical protein AAFO72_07970 [Pseudomonadota bacterium]